MNYNDTSIILGLIPARGGSQGVANKNLRLVNGISLLDRAIKTAKASHLIDRVIVSTDDQAIISAAQECGAEVPFKRPQHLATNDSPEWLTWQHTLEYIRQSEPNCEIKALVCIPPTSPLRNTIDIDVCIQELLNTDADIVITVTQSDHNPYFNMIELNPHGYAKLAIIPENPISRRQDAPDIFDITTVAYAAKPDFIMSCNSIFEGKVRTVNVPPERAIDIDTEMDLLFAEFLAARQN